MAISGSIPGLPFLHYAHFCYLTFPQWTFRAPLDVVAYNRVYPSGRAL